MTDLIESRVDPIYGIGIVDSIRMEVAEDLAREELVGLEEDDRKELARSYALARLQAISMERMAAGADPLATADEQRIAQEVLDALFGLGRLQALIDDQSIENIDVNGFDVVWATRADGTKSLCEPVASSDEELVDLIRNAAARLGHSERRFDNSHPELDLRLPDGSRLSALMAVTRRPVMSIRRHRFMSLGLDDLVRLDAMSYGLASLLGAAVRARKNIIIAGAMNSGKTTLMRALCNEIPSRERIVTIEQAFELGLDTMPDRYPDLVALEARQANAEGVGEIPMGRLVRRGLRMNADRVIVGEVLGNEIIPMLNAMSQGRSGSMCTIHADSSAGVFRRIASYAVQAAERLPIEATNLLIAGAIHFVVFLDVTMKASGMDAGISSDFRVQDRCGDLYVAADPSNGQSQRLHGRGTARFEAAKRSRFISSVREVVDAEGVQVISNEVFRPGRDRRAVEGAPLRAETLDELVEHGYDPSLDFNNRFEQ
ncbi:MAG: CpaF family protein [Acidimicrobiales bacterium]